MVFEQKNIISNRNLVMYKKTKNTYIKFLFEYDEEIINVLKKIPTRKYNWKDRIWECELTKTTAEYIELFAEYYNFNIPDNLSNKFKEFKKDNALNLELSKSFSDTFEFKNIKGEPRPFQFAGVKYIVKNGRIILGDEQGLGKTLQAIASFHYTEYYPVLIICSKNLQYNWKQEILKWSTVITEDDISIINITKKQVDCTKKIVIMNYEVVAKLSKEIKANKFKTLICDESQKLKNSKSQRTKAVESLKKLFKHIYLLTGTPISSRPLELVSQLSIIDKLKDFGGRWNFMNRYCDPQEGYFGMEYKGASNLTELHTKLRQYCYLRRNKSEVAKELPSKTISLVYLDLDNEKEYIKAEKSLVRYVRDNYKIQNKTLNLNNKKELLDLTLKINGSEGFANIATLKGLASKGKMKNTINWIEDFLESGEKLVVFAYYTDTVKTIAEHFKCKYIFGNTPLENRQKYVNEFQDNPDIKLIVLNIDVGKEGITLTASHNLVCVDLPNSWSPADLDQMYDRIHRIGQEFPCNYYHLFGKNTIELYIYNVIQSKRVIVTEVNSGEQIEVDLLDLNKQSKTSLIKDYFNK